jgi:hypothetical protein
LEDAEKRIVATDNWDDCLIEVITKDTASLSYDFPRLKENGDVTIVTSDDGKLRFYTWDTGRGGTMIDWECVIQYRIENEVYASSLSIYDLPEFDKIRKKNKHEVNYEKCAVLNLLTLKSATGDNCYAAEVYFRESANLAYYGMIGLTFQDNQLVRYPLFVDSSENLLTEIGYEGTIADWYFRTDGLGWDWVYAYESETKCLYEPLCEGSGYFMTDRYNVYKYNGEHFVFARKDAGYWLHPSLRTFDFLNGIFKTSAHTVRIDLLDDGTFRYASWQHPKDMSEKPDLVITQGQYDVENDILLFYNYGYRYEVYLDTSRDGSYQHEFEGIKLYKNGRFVLNEPVLE